MESNKRIGAEKIRWNLRDLYANDSALERDLKKYNSRASEFAHKYRGKIPSQGPTELLTVLNQLEELQEGLGRAYSYAYLNWCTDTEDASRGALFQKVRERYSEIQQRLLFFELEWVQLETKRAEELLKSEQLSRYCHYLELLRLKKNHLLSEPEEKILSEKSVTGREAWIRLFDEILGAVRFNVGNRQLTSEETLSRLYLPDREVRRKAALSFTEGLQTRLRELTYISNTLLAEKFSHDRLRNYPNWLSSRNLSNEISDVAVQTLIKAVTSRYDLVARYYRLKRKLLGLRVLKDYDRYAPLEKAQDIHSWDQARIFVLEAYKSFHPRLEYIAASFFDKKWIDAPVVPGKVGGAFSHSTVPSVHPYILMNYTGTLRDVQTLAHELGHGVHQYLSRKQGFFQAQSPLTMAETASVFGEILTFDLLMKTERRPEVRLSMIMSKIEDILATVFRQISMSSFEDRIHTFRRDKGELSTDDFNELWMETQEEMFRGSVKLGEHYKIWWSYIPHFLHTPGYVYAYAFGELLVLSLYELYQKEGDPFVEKYIALLEAGGSDWPDRLLLGLGVDLKDHGLWQQGLCAIESLIVKAEDLAENRS